MSIFNSEITDSRKKKPFNYIVIDDFLDHKNFKMIQGYLNTLEHKELKSDLFSFKQSGELNYEPEMFPLKNKIEEYFASDINMKEMYYTLFSSIYDYGDYLLCHDDRISGRKYAFAYYLSNIDSGRLIIYENDCQTVFEKIAVKENRIVIFEVSKISFHEVEYCESYGRRAISGWINSRVEAGKIEQPKFVGNVYNNIFHYNIGIDINTIEDDIIFFKFKDIEVKELRRLKSGKLIDRKCEEIILEKVFVPRFDGYKLVHTEIISIVKGDYILINDNINRLDEVFDVIYFKCKRNVENFIIFSGKSIQDSFAIDALNGSMFICKRKGQAMCIPRTDNEVEFKHFMYVKEC